MQARAGYIEALTLRPGTVPPLPDDDYDPDFDQRSLGLVHALLGDQAAAVAAYDAFLLLRGNDHIGLYNRANALWRLGKTGEAEAGYRQAIAASHGFAEARVNLAELLISLKRSDEGIALALATIDMQPVRRSWPIAGEEQPWVLFDALATGYLVKATSLDDDVSYLRKCLGALDAGLCTPVPLTSMTEDTRTVMARIYLRRGFAHAKLGDRAMARLDLLQAQGYAPSYSVISLTAAQFLSHLSHGQVRTVLRFDHAGLIVAMFSAALLVLVSVQVVRGALGDATFASVAVASLGAMLLGVSLPHLTSFKLGVAEASLSTTVVTMTAFELPEITAPPA